MFYLPNNRSRHSASISPEFSPFVECFDLLRNVCNILIFGICNIRENVKYSNLAKVSLGLFSFCTDSHLTSGVATYVHRNHSDQL